MKPLAYLWWRQIVNGIKRAVSSPRRLLSVLVGIGYYVGFFMRPWDQKPVFTGNEKWLPQGMIPELNSIETGLFIGLMFIGSLFAASVFAFKNTFRPADVDVLFPTPVSTKMVMGLRLFREILTTLLFPLILLFFGYKPFLGAAKRLSADDPRNFSLLIQGSILAWVVTSFVWVGISYAMSFLVAKYEKQSKVITRTVGWTVAIGVVAVYATYALRMYLNPSWETMVSTSQMAHVKAIMLIPYLGTKMATAPIAGSTIGFLVPLLVMGAIAVGSLWYASTLSGWMYDQAATKGFQSQTMRDLQRKGDMSAMLAENARAGKIKQGRLAKRIQGITLRNGWALLYKEFLLQARTGVFMSVMFMVILTGIAIMFLTLPMETKRGTQLGPYFYFAMCGFMAVQFGSISALTGFTETLRRVEVIKPLPLSARQIAFYEVAAKSIFALAFSIIPFLVGLIYKPSLWEFHLSGLIAAPSTAVAMVAAIFLVVVLFPDFDDVTQRSFRGLMQLLGMVFVMGPVTGLFLLNGMVLKFSPLVPAVASAGLCAVMVILFTSIAGRFYIDFNPSE